MLDEWEAGPETLRGPPAPGFLERYRIPTGVLGGWILYDVSSSGLPTVTRVDAGGIERTSFGQDCTGSTEVVRSETASDADSTALFTDEDLRAVLAVSGESATSVRATVVYVWSPHLSLSVEGHAEIAEACRQLGLGLVPVLFPGVDRAFARREAARVRIGPDGLREAAALELRLRDLLVHAPALLVFAGERVSPVLPGYRDAAGYRRVLESFLSSGPLAIE